MTLVGFSTGNTSAGQIPKAYQASVFKHASKTYAVVTKNQPNQQQGGFVVVDLSDPNSPTKVSEKTDVTEGDNDNPEDDWELLNGSFDVTTAVVGSVPYAVISQNLGGGGSKGGGKGKGGSKGGKGSGKGKGGKGDSGKGKGKGKGSKGGKGKGKGGRGE